MFKLFIFVGAKVGIKNRYYKKKYLFSDREIPIHLWGNRIYASAFFFPNSGSILRNAVTIYVSEQAATTMRKNA